MRSAQDVGSPRIISRLILLRVVMPLAAPRNHENGLCDGYPNRWCLFSGRRPFCDWCHKPALEFGLDIVTNPKLSPPTQRGARRADCLLIDVLRGRDHPGDSLWIPSTPAVPASMSTRTTSSSASAAVTTPVSPVEEVRTFSTMTADLLALSDWLAGHGVTHVAMESTGVYWKPVFNILGGRFEVILVNAEHIKQVPGRKTDVKDCQWIAQLLQHGLLKASFVPPSRFGSCVT